MGILPGGASTSSPPHEPAWPRQLRDCFLAVGGVASALEPVGRVPATAVASPTGVASVDLTFFPMDMFQLIIFFQRHSLIG